MICNPFHSFTFQNHYWICDVHVRDLHELYRSNDNFEKRKNVIKKDRENVYSTKKKQS